MCHCAAEDTTKICKPNFLILSRKRSGQGQPKGVNLGISYIIAYNPSEHCNERIFYNILHDSGR